MACINIFKPTSLFRIEIFYDERGVSIHHQGDFRLEEAVLGPMLTSFRGTVQGSGLHRIDLPTGPAIYFLRQGALTLVACFSGSPRPDQLEEGLHLLRQQELSMEELLHDLSPDVATLAVSLLNAPVERDLLTYLWTNRRVE